jgi:hypothetical protein
LLCCLFCLLLGLSVRAEDLLPRVQRELRARKFYFGEIDGHATEETVTAIKNFQLSKGIDSTGLLDGGTLRALGFADAVGDTEEGRLLEECNTCVLRYLQAWQSGRWEREGAFFADVVNYYDDQNVARDFIRQVRAKEIVRWPHRKSTLLNRIASLEPGHKDLAQVTARVRTEVAADSGSAEVQTEDLLFRLQKTDGGWKIAAVKLVKQLE